MVRGRVPYAPRVNGRSTVVSDKARVQVVGPASPAREPTDGVLPPELTFIVVHRARPETPKVTAIVAVTVPVLGTFPLGRAGSVPRP